MDEWLTTQSRLTENELALYKSSFQVFVDQGYLEPAIPLINGQMSTCNSTSLDDRYNVSLHRTCPVRRYIACFPVTDVNSKTTRCRIVLDSRADNEYYRQLPVGSRNTDSSLYSNFLKFRVYRYFSLLDLSRAFLEVGLASGDGEWNGTVCLGRSYRFTRLPFGVSYAPYGLKRALDGIIRLWKCKLAESVVCERVDGFLDGDEWSLGESSQNITITSDELDFLSYYLDDLNVSCDTKGLVIALTDFIIGHLKDHGARNNEEKMVTNVINEGMKPFKYLGYTIINDNIVSRFGTGRGAAGVKMIIEELSKAMKEHNNVEIEDLNIMLNKVLPSEARKSKYAIPSRAMAVGILAMEYDPCGLFIEHSAQARLLIRKINNECKNWDDLIQNVTFEEVLKWFRFVQDPSNEISWPRYIDCPPELCVYCDASEDLWSVDVRTSGESSTPCIRVFGAVGLHERRDRTIPSKELDSLYRAVKLAENLRRDFYAMPTTKTKWPMVTFYTDSQINLLRLRAYARNAANKLDIGLYERNRLRYIVDALSEMVSKVYFLKGDCNPADRATRPYNTPMTSGELSKVMYNFSGDLFFDPLNYDQISIHNKTIAMAAEMGEVMQCSDLVFDYEDATLRERIRRAQQSDPFVQSVINKVKGGAKVKDPSLRGFFVNDYGLLCRHSLDWSQEEDGEETVNFGERIVIPKLAFELQEDIIRAYHVHHGAAKNLRLLTNKFHFKGLNRLCRRYCEQCSLCDELRSQAALRKALGAIPEWQSNIAICEVVAIDICGPLCNSNTDLENMPRYYLSIVCLCSKFMWNIPITNRLTSTIISALKEFFKWESIPHCIISDREASFLSRQFQLFLQMQPHKVVHLCSPAYSGAHNGYFERLHADITHSIKVSLKITGDPIWQWYKHLDAATRLYNSTPYSIDSDLSPFHLVRGYDPRSMNELYDKDYEKELHLLPPTPYLISKDIVNKIKDQKTIKYKLYRDIWMSRRRESYERVLKDINTNKNYKVGMLVYRWRPRAKLLCVWDGPWRIYKILGSRALLKLVSQESIEAYESLLNLRPSKQNDENKTNIDDNEDHDYWVECSLCHKWRRVTHDIAVQSSTRDVICEDLGADCSQACDWIIINTPKDDMAKNEENTNIKPVLKFNKNMTGSCLLLVTFTSEIKLSHYIGIINSVNDDGHSLLMITPQGMMNVALKEDNVCYVFPLANNISLANLYDNLPPLLIRALKDVYGEAYTLPAF